MSDKKDNFYENLTDLEIISIIQGGDYYPFELLFLRYEPLVKKMVQTYYLQGYEKDDFYQESRLVFDKVIKTYDSERGLTFGSFYKVTLRHHFFSLIRKDMAKKRKADKFADSLEMLAEAGKLPNSMFAKSDYTYQEALEVKESIPGYFSALSGLEYETFTRYLKNATIKEIAQELHCEEIKVINALDRCKRKMRHYFN